METHAAPSVLNAAEAPEPVAVRGNRINVLFLTIDITIGGSERLVLDLVRNLDRRLFSPSVGWFSNEQAPREFENLGVPLFPLQKRPGFDWRAMRKLAHIVRGHQIDIINAHHFMSFFYACYACRLANRAGLVFTEHSEADVRSATGMWRAAGALLLRRTDAVVGVSPGVSAALRSHFGLAAERVRTVENGVDVDRFQNIDQSRESVRKTLQLDEDDLVIGHVANFRRNKNHLFLLRAFQRAFGARTGVKLLLVGQGFPGDPENSEPEVRTFIRNSRLEGSVHLLGYRSDVHDLLRAMDVSCLVSYKEGLPLSVIEAMATGLPIVATDIDGLRDIVQHGVHGVLVAPDDVDGLARQLEHLAADSALRRRLGASGRRAALDRYSFRRCLSDTQNLLLSVASRSPAGGIREGASRC